MWGQTSSSSQRDRISGYKHVPRNSQASSSTIFWPHTKHVTEEEGGEPQKSRWIVCQKLTCGRDSKHRLLHSYASLCLPSSFRERAFRKSARIFSLSRLKAFSLSSSAFSYNPYMQETTSSQLRHSRLTPPSVWMQMFYLSAENRNIKGGWKYIYYLTHRPVYKHTKPTVLEHFVKSCKTQNTSKSVNARIKTAWATLSCLPPYLGHVTFDSL